MAHDGPALTFIAVCARLTDAREADLDEGLAHRADGPGYYPGRDFTGRPNLVAIFRGAAPTGLSGGVASLF